MASDLWARLSRWQMRGEVKVRRCGDNGWVCVLASVESAGIVGKGATADTAVEHALELWGEP